MCMLLYVCVVFHLVPSNQYRDSGCFWFHDVWNTILVFMFHQVGMHPPESKYPSQAYVEINSAILQVLSWSKISKLELIPHRSVGLGSSFLTPIFLSVDIVSLKLWGWRRFSRKVQLPMHVSTLISRFLGCFKVRNQLIGQSDAESTAWWRIQMDFVLLRRCTRTNSGSQTRFAHSLPHSEMLNIIWKYLKLFCRCKPTTVTSGWHPKCALRSSERSLGTCRPWNHMLPNGLWHSE